MSDFTNDKNFTSNTGTVTSITAGAGLTGNTISTSGTIALETSGVTAASYGPSQDATPAHGGEFVVPSITVDTYGRITSASEKKITLPGSGHVNADWSATSGSAEIKNKPTIPTSSTVEG